MGSTPDLSKTAHARPAAEVLEGLGVTVARGLSEADAAERLRAVGPNLLARRRPADALKILYHQFASPVVALLAAAAVVSLAYGEVVEALAIGLVLALNAAIGFVAEIRAVRSMEALRRLGAVTTRIRRDGRMRVVPAQNLVPGDIVVLEGGDVVTADLRLVEASNIAADESTLTGESVPVEKSVAPDPPGARPGDIGSMVFKGSAITRGGGEAVVVATGMNTELGRISALVAEAEPERSPLERKLDRLAGRLIWVTLVLSGAIGVFGVMSGEDTFLMIEAAIALAVAAIPEGLPIVATMALARGIWRMARQNALIERLSAVETLGATTIIFTDKTGTLTENRLSVRALVTEDEAEAARTGLLQVAALCNNAELATEGHAASGDPIEVALLKAAQDAGFERDALLADAPRAGGVAFESETAMMATIHRAEGGFLYCVKGAPEAVLRCSSRVLGPGGEADLDDRAREDWLHHTGELAESGLRVLAMAWKRAPRADEEAYDDLVFLGLAGLSDPPRADVPDAIGACRDAGVRVVMITGDHAVTARRIAGAIGLDEEGVVIEGRELKPVAELTEAEKERILAANIFARVNPKQKLELVALHQERGEVVAMTGDGVNDAPALKKADIGVAMGLRGTQVAKEAAAMVLTDDAFATIVRAIREGRVIFRNIQRFVAYLLSCNLSEILVVGLAVPAGLPLPLLPLQILLLNLVTDVFPAFALGVGSGDPGILKRPPRDPSKGILTRSIWGLIVGAGLAITVSTLGAFVLATEWMELERDQSLTVAFMTLALAQLWNVFNMRDPRTSLFDNDIMRNRYVWGSLVGCAALLLALIHIPPAAATLHLAPLDAEAWALVVGASLLPILLMLPGKAMTRRD